MSKPSRVGEDSDAHRRPHVGPHGTGQHGAHEDLGHRLRLPRGGARGVDGRTRPRRRRHRRRRAQDRGARPAQGAVLRARASTSCWRATLATGRLRFSDRHRRRRRRARSTSSAWARRRSAASTPPTCATSRRATESLLAVLRPGDLVVGKSTVPGRHGGAPGRAGRGQGARRACWPGTPSSSARASRSQDTLHPDRLVYGLPVRRGRRAPPARCSTRSTRRSLAARHPAGGHRLRDRRAGQGGRQLLPRHEDLLHQRDGRAVRGHRRRREAARRRDRLRRPHRPQVPQRRPRLRRRLPAQGHPRVHGPGRRARVPTRR